VWKLGRSLHHISDFIQEQADGESHLHDEGPTPLGNGREYKCLLCILVEDDLLKGRPPVFLIDMGKPVSVQ